jgi:DNA-binding response OmpR family regulator
VLVAADDADIRELVLLKLQQAGFDVRLAEDGLSALAAQIRQQAGGSGVGEHCPLCERPRRAT